MRQVGELDWEGEDGQGFLLCDESAAVDVWEGRTCLHAVDGIPPRIPCDYKWYSFDVIELNGMAHRKKGTNHSKSVQIHIMAYQEINSENKKRLMSRVLKLLTDGQMPLIFSSRPSLKSLRNFSDGIQATFVRDGCA
jgi:hypothetical protein